LQQEKTYEIRLSEDFLAAFAERSFSADGFMREMLTNAWEADAPRVDITLSPDGRLTIEDWGSGMSHEQLVGYLTVGRSTKKGTLSPVFKRRCLGEFGVGKLSLVKVSKYVTVQTHQNGFDKILVFDEKTLSTRQTKVVDGPEMVHDGVRLTAVPRSGLEGLFSVNRLRYYIQSNLNNLLEDQTFAIYLNGEQIEPLTIKAFTTSVDIDHYVLGLGRVKGTILVSRTGKIRKELQGIAVTVNGGAIGPRTLFGAESWGHGYSMEKISGKVEATFLEPAVLYSREGFDEASREYAAFKDAMKRIMATDVKKALDMNKTIALKKLAAQAYYQFLDRLASVFEKESQYRLDNVEGGSAAHEAALATPDVQLEEPVRQVIEEARGNLNWQQRTEKEPGKKAETAAPVAEPAPGPLEDIQLLQLEHQENTDLLPEMRNEPSPNRPRRHIDEIRVRPRMVAGWLVLFAHMENAEIPAIRENNTIIINSSYAGFKALSTNKEAVFHYIARIVTQEISKAFNKEAIAAYDAQNRLLTQVYLTQDE
jgi:NOL1/NOP2/fmu family ribosome biogenesis protein